MKKLAVLIATSVLALVGLVVAPGAIAAEPYPQSVDTTCTVDTNSPVREGREVRVRVDWVSAGTASPRGKVEVTIVRKRDDKVVRDAERAFYGRPLTFTFKGLDAGGYGVQVKATTPRNSIFQGCSTGTFLRVRNR